MSIAQDPEVEMITIDGQSYFEIKIDDPSEDGQGNLIERVEITEEASYEDLEGEIQDAKDRLKDRAKSSESSKHDEFRERFGDLADRSEP